MSENSCIDEKAVKRDRFNWWLPFYFAVGALILFVATITIYIDELLYIFVVAPIISLILLVIALVAAIRGNRRRGLAVLSMLVVYWAISWGLFENSRELRQTARWLLWSKEYKAKVLAQPGTKDRELRHIEWDGWGMAGQDTVAYLCFDPNDSLSTAAKSNSPGKFSGIPCEVYSVRRLECHFYSVVFYTNTDWTFCK